MDFRCRALIAPAVTRRLLDEFVRQPRPGDAADTLAALTQREHEVLLHLSRGMSNRQIAAQLFLGAATIKTHVGSLLAKLGLRDRVHAVVYAYETGIIRPGRADD